MGPRTHVAQFDRYRTFLGLSLWHMAGEASGRGLHQECAPHLPHQDAHDQAGAGQGPKPGHRKLGPLPAQVPEEEREAQEANHCEEARIHALPAPSAAQQSGFAAGVGRVLSVTVSEGQPEGSQPAGAAAATCASQERAAPGGFPASSGVAQPALLFCRI